MAGTRRRSPDHRGRRRYQPWRRRRVGPGPIAAICRGVGASDVHAKVGSRPRLRVDGRLREGPFDIIEPSDTERVVAGTIPPRSGGVPPDLVHLYRNGLVGRDDAIAHANAASEMRFSLERADLERTNETPAPPPPPTASQIPAAPVDEQAAPV